MAIDLKIENFQSWEAVELTIDGVTAIIGPSNVGKSSVARALKAIFRNQLKQNSVRIGQDGGMLIEATINGHHIVARRGKKESASYVVDGQPYESLGRAIPDAVTALGLNDIVVGDTTLDPIFSGQFDKQFLLQESPTTNNKVLGAFSSTEKLELGKKKANSRIKEKNAQAKETAKELRALEERNARLEVIVQRADVLEAEINTLEPQIDRNDAILRTIYVLEDNRDRLNKHQAVFDQLVVPDVAELAASIQVVEALHIASESQASLAGAHSTVQQLVVPDLQPAMATLHTVEAATRAAHALGTRDRAQAAFDAIVATADLWDTVRASYATVKALVEAHEAYVAQEASVARNYAGQVERHATQIDERLRGCTATASVIDVLDTAIKHLSNRAQTEARLTEVEAEFEELQSTIKTLERDIHEQEHNTHKNTTCPKCGELVLI